ncbi:Xaa-Pro peptidase family protein [Emcibacteraceae bacterium]|nr:Xaa-Pro peptidase family protein [Emcibacteraceae bacterium]MDC0082088.1 Xaa-Pro peptidase family protein [Emcibacteraceae bacterium]MDC1428849.1 Xaa-Pro peptidase family protein [Emcibacteraceae bacterium]
MSEQTISSWFTTQEYRTRLTKIQNELKKRDLDGLVTFQPETITWTTGYYTKAYTGFQLAVIPAEGEPYIMCRNVSAYYVEKTYVFSEYEYWIDGDNKIERALALISRALGSSARIGIEADAWPVSFSMYQKLVDGLPNAQWIDVGEMAARLRIIKSPAEIDYQRRAARAAEAGMTAGIEAAVAGNNEREVCGAVCSAMVIAGSDHPGPGVLSSGERAYHLHGGATDRILKAGDTLQLEPTPHVRHYNARFMRTIKVGEATDEEYKIAETLINTQDKALETVAPGVKATVPDHLYREGILGSGLTDTYTNKTFYSIGIMMDPTDADPLEATASSEWSFEVGMTFHSYLLVKDFGFSETIAVTEDGFERLTQYPRKLFVS